MNTIFYILIAVVMGAIIFHFITLKQKEIKMLEIQKRLRSIYNAQLLSWQVINKILKKIQKQEMLKNEQGSPQKTNEK